MLRVLAVTLLGGLIALPAAAQTVCGERSDFVSHLSRQYHEAPAAMGLVSNGALLEILTSNTGTWTVIITRPDGVSCVVAAGESWEQLPTLAAGPQA